MLRLAVGARRRALQSKIALDFGQVFAAKPEATAAGRGGEACEARRGGEQPQQGGDERAPRRGRRRAVQDDAHRAGSGFERRLEILGRFGRGRLERDAEKMDFGLRTIGIRRPCRMSTVNCSLAEGQKKVVGIVERCIVERCIFNRAVRSMAMYTYRIEPLQLVELGGSGWRRQVKLYRV